MSNFTYNDELYHYGVKGMKWGVRRYQNKDGTRTEAGKARYRTGKSHRVYGGIKIIDAFNRKKYGVDIDNETQTSSESHTRILDKPVAGLTIGLDTYLAVSNTIGAIANVSIGNIPMAYMDLYFAGRSINRLASAGAAKINESMYFKKRQEKPVDKKTGFVKKDKEMNQADDLKYVNPAYNTYNPDKHNNCMLCTTAYDLRRRGYDVTANVASYGYSTGDIKRWYPKAVIKNVSAADENGKYSGKTLVNNTISELSKQKNARGNLAVGWNLGGGHSMVYEVKDGKVTILDSQTNTIYGNPEKILKKVKQVSYVRLDNVEPDYEKIKECVR